MRDLRDSDPEGLAFHRDNLERASRALTARGLDAHSEPLEAEYWWGAEMFGYSGLHYLRRVAAHLELRGRLPEPGTNEASNDPVLAAYCDRASGTTRGIRRLFGKRRPTRMGFDHLILHSDAQGYYVPVDFPDVIFGASENEILGGMLGSSPRLLAECEALIQALEIPPDIDPEGDELWDAADNQGDGEGWRRYGVEAFTCVQLREAARRSVQQRSAIVFC